MPLVGRLDPTASADVVGLVAAQGQTAQRFSRAQISNFQRRMESLHRRADADNSYAAGYAGINSAQFYSAQTAKPTAPQPASLLNALASAATTGSLNLANSSEGTSEFAEDTSIWIGGNVNFGFRDSMNSSSLRYSTDGISIGVDRRVSNKLALGLGLGYARDKSEIGSDGTKTQATGSSLALYGSYQPTPVIYVDGLLGYGVQSFDTDRYVAVVTDYAHSQRDRKSVV